MEKKRNILFDNIRVVLIIFVVFGHAIEQIRFEDKIFLGIYNFIYLFHMPLFVFCSGAFAKSDKKRIVKKYLIPYVVFQTLYGIFDVYIMKAESFHFLESYYVLWYILALAAWNFVLPFFQTGGREKKQVLLLIGSIVAGLLAGFVDSIGKEFSLSRILVFFPFFLAGYYIKQEGMYENRIKKAAIYKERKRVKWMALSLLLVIAAGVYLCTPMINTWALFGYTSYAFQGYTVYFRMLQYLAAVCLGILIFLIVPGKKVFAPFTAKHLMGIYLSHVLIIKCIEKTGILSRLNNSLERFLYSVGITVLLMMAGVGVSYLGKKWKVRERKNK